MDCMNSIIEVNKALFLSSFSFLLQKSKSLVIDKLFGCRILESLKLFFFQKRLHCTIVIETMRKKMFFVNLLTTTNNEGLRNLQNYE